MISKAESLKRWDFKLKEILDKICSGQKYLNIGFIGALGCLDIGDEAMLVADIEKIKNITTSIVNQVVYSMYPDNTNNYLNIKSEIFYYSIFRKNYIYRILRVIDYLIFNNIFKTKDLTSRIFAILLLHISLIKILIGDKIFSDDTKLLNKYEKSHVMSIKKLDVLYVIGGGYLNSWHVNSTIYSFLMEIYIANYFKIPVIISGLNLGPFNKIDRYYTIKALKLNNVKLIGLRDWEHSIDILMMGKHDLDNVYFSHDDAYYLEYKNEENPFTKKNYAILQIHTWRGKKSDHQILIDVYSQIVKRLSKMGIIAIFISMVSDIKYSDFKLANEIVKKCNGNNVILVREILQPKRIKKICSEARIIICTRHHPFLFGISTMTPSVAFCYDKYYKQKLSGIIVNNKVKYRIFDINSLNIDSIIDSIVSLIKGEEE